MRYLIPLLGDRVAPRCTSANGMLIVKLNKGDIVSKQHMSLNAPTTLDYSYQLKRFRIDILVCGGISRDMRDILKSENIDIVENVACSADEILVALEEGTLLSGFGISTQLNRNNIHQDLGVVDEFDCLKCLDRKCLYGEPCSTNLKSIIKPSSTYVQQVMEATVDVALDEERHLCRLSELIYFCLEMNYHRLGIAFCIDLLEPAEILSRVLRRFFDVVPICCKIGSWVDQKIVDYEYEDNLSYPAHRFACNPVAQAQVLNERDTDLNIIVGLCVGADCLFTTSSNAPVTTLFVKDKSLSNNPIGALYSEYYLQENLALGHTYNRLNIKNNQNPTSAKDNVARSHIRSEQKEGS